jgi:membrane-bound inhibitor of C-type lysozyme
MSRDLPLAAPRARQRLRPPGALALACALALVANGCSWFRSPPTKGAEVKLPPDAVAYLCEQNKRLIVRYPVGGRYAIVMLPDREFRLDAVESGSGARFSNGRTTLASQGEEAMLEDQGTALFANCRREVAAPAKK